MISEALDRRIETLIKELIEDGGVSAASLASILVAAQGAAQGGHGIALCRLIWSASHALEEGSIDRDRRLPPSADRPLLAPSFPVG